MIQNDMSDINFELIAIKIGEAIKFHLSVNEIERLAKATLKIDKRHFEHENITSMRAQTIYDWIKSLEFSSLPLEEKIKRCTSLVETLEIDPKTKEDILRLLKIKKKDENLVDKTLQDLKKLPVDPALILNLEKRLMELEKCISVKAYLSSIIMIGSILEGLLLAVVKLNPKEANMSRYAPKDKNGKVKEFQEWKLQHLISVCYDCKWIDRDIKDFSEVLRDYRNMIHPHHNVSKGIYPDHDTVRICIEVLKAVINDLKRHLGT